MNRGRMERIGFFFGKWDWGKGKGSNGIGEFSMVRVGTRRMFYARDGGQHQKNATDGFGWARGFSTVSGLGCACCVYVVMVDNEKENLVMG